MPVADTIVAILVAIGARELLAAAVPRAIEAWRKSRASAAEVEVARARVAEREASQRIETRRAHVEELGVAERIVLDRADELRAREAEHAETRAGHLECLRKVGRLEGEVGRLEGEVVAERTARQSLERVLVWVLDLVGPDHEPPPEDVAKTLDRIRPTLSPEPAE